MPGAGRRPEVVRKNASAGCCVTLPSRLDNCGAPVRGSRCGVPRRTTRQKHTPLNTSVSLYSSVYDPDSDRTLLDTIPEEHTPNPEGAVIQQQFLDGLQASMNGGLSDLECSVLKNHLWGKSYQETATELERGVKSIDNALQRAKRKIGKDLRRSMILGP